MSLLLKKIELSNIRAHKHFVLEPTLSGITAISGSNGAGKSTIVDSVAWCLYGTKPKGVGKIVNMVNDAATLGKDKCFVEVEMECDDFELKVLRKFVNKTGSLECDTWERKIGDEEWEHTSGPAVSHADIYIKKRLMMDEKGFLSAIFVQQKQVDELITAGPKERAEVIEKLTGITAITIALGKAQENYRDFKKNLQLTDYDPDEKERLTKEQEQLSKKIETKEKFLLTNKDKMEKNSSHLKDLKTKISTDEKYATQMQTLINNKTKCETVIEATETELERLLKLKEIKKAQLPAKFSTVDYDEYKSKLANVKKTLQDNNQQIGVIGTSVSNDKERLKSYEELLEKANIKELSKAVEGRDKLQQKLELGKNKISDLQQKISINEGEIKSIDSAIAVIEEGDGTCPTCLQEVHDKEKAIEKLNDDKEMHTVNRDGFKDSLSSINDKIPSLSENIAKFEQLIEALENSEKLEKSISENEKEIVTLQEANISLETEEKNYSNVLSKIENYQAVKGEYDELLQQSIALSDKKEKAQNALNDIEVKLKEISTKTSGSIDKLREDYDKAFEDYEALNSSYNAFKEEVAVLVEQKKAVDMNLSRSEELYEKYQSTLKTIEVASVSVDMLDEFRKNRIRTSIPVVNNFASDLLNRFTDGKFIQLRLDEKFNATVTLSNGVERPVGMLSGGELSSAALALRLAISLLLNVGKSKNMMMLDEVLVSQDATRSEQILTTIKEVCKGQLIMISHGPNTNDIADKVVEL